MQISHKLASVVGPEFKMARKQKVHPCYNMCRCFWFVLKSYARDIMVRKLTEGKMLGVCLRPSLYLRFF